MIELKLLYLKLASKINSKQILTYEEDIDLTKLIRNKRLKERELVVVSRI